MSELAPKDVKHKLKLIVEPDMVSLISEAMPMKVDYCCPFFFCRPPHLFHVKAILCFA